MSRRRSRIAKRIPFLGPRIAELRRLRFQRDLAGMYPPGHFYSPIPSRRDAEAALETAGHRGDLPGIDLREAEQVALLEELQQYHDGTPLDGAYRLDNLFYASSDGILLHCMVRHLEPSTIVEIGGGFSTANMVETRLAFPPASPTRHVVVEPDPRRLQQLLGPKIDHVEVRATRLQDTDPALFDELGDGDVLFIDSTHVLKAGSDVAMILFEVLPRLRPGVYVHIHDVHYPFEYPELWLRSGRWWTETYAVRAFLTFNTEFQIELFSTYLLETRREWFAEHMPRCLEEPSTPITVPGSLWLRRRP